MILFWEILPSANIMYAKKKKNEKNVVFFQNEAFLYNKNGS